MFTMLRWIFFLHLSFLLLTPILKLWIIIQSFPCSCLHACIRVYLFVMNSTDGYSGVSDSDDEAHQIPLIRPRASSVGSIQNHAHIVQKRVHPKMQIQALKHIPRISGLPLTRVRRRLVRKGPIPGRMVSTLSDMEEEIPPARRIAAYCFAQVMGESTNVPESAWRKSASIKRQ